MAVRGAHTRTVLPRSRWNADHAVRSDSARPSVNDLARSSHSRTARAQRGRVRLAGQSQPGGQEGVIAPTAEPSSVAAAARLSRSPPPRGKAEACVAPSRS